MSESSVYVVLGGSGGIGSEVCRRLAGRGDAVLGVARSDERLSRLAAETGVETLSADATRFVASAIVWLLDPEQSWVTGQVLGVDGGLGSARTMPGG